MSSADQELITLLDQLRSSLVSGSLNSGERILLMELMVKHRMIRTNSRILGDDLLKYTFIGAYIYHLLDSSDTNNSVHSIQTNNK